MVETGVVSWLVMVKVKGLARASISGEERVLMFCSLLRDSRFRTSAELCLCRVFGEENRLSNVKILFLVGVLSLGCADDG